MYSFDNCGLRERVNTLTITFLKLHQFTINKECLILCKNTI